MPPIHTLQDKLLPLLRIPAWMYARGMYWRSRWYSARPPGKDHPLCISVGNIAVGGRGKSPFCRYLSARILGKNLTPVLLTRGYKARPPAYPHRVALEDSPAVCGDEPLDLLHRLPEMEILVDPRRKRSAEWAIAHLGADILLLDDGFQHLQMPRHTDIVLLSTSDLGPGWNRTFPAGNWREGKDALKRANILAVNMDGPKPQETRELARKRLSGLDKPVIFFTTTPCGLRRVKDNQPIEKICGDYLLVSGIASPERFAATATDFCGVPPKARLFFSDHRNFSSRDWQRICSFAREKNCRYILCTSKDAVKLRSFAGNKLFSLDVDISLSTEDESRLLEILQKTMEHVRPSLEIVYPNNGNTPGVC